MICPLKFNLVTLNAETQEQLNRNCQCEEYDCDWWDEPKRQCCIKTLSELKITGGVNVHPY